MTLNVHLMFPFGNEELYLICLLIVYKICLHLHVVFIYVLYCTDTYVSIFCVLYLV